MGFLKRLFCGCPDNYDICEERGHDYREDVEMEHEADVHLNRMKPHRKHYDVSDHVKVVQEYRTEKFTRLRVKSNSLRVCRDCGKERRTTKESQSLVLCEDGRFRPMPDLFTRDEENE